MIPPEYGVNVSRETLARLEGYGAELEKWNRQINLVAKSTISTLWERHVLDCVQIFKFRQPNDLKWVDMGSGGGLPGLIVGILAKELAPEMQTVLIESDHRKSSFLRQISAKYGLNCQIVSKRIEDVPPQNANIISARALASLSELLHLGEPHLTTNGRFVLMKGQRYSEEITLAKQEWTFDVAATVSLTDSEARILELQNIKKKS